jgi:ATP-binding cassette subfamily B protein
VLNKVFDLAPPLLIGAAVDIVVKREGSLIGRFGFPDLDAQLVILAALTLLIWGLESVFEYAFGVLWRNLAQTAQHELRLQAYAHVQDLEMAWFAERSRGGLMAVLNDDVNQLERFLDHGANDLLQVSTTVVVVGGIFFTISPLITLLAFVPVPLILLGSFKFQSRIAPRYAKVRERVARLNAILANGLLGIATVKSFTGEAREVERVRAASEAYQDANREAIRLSSAFSPLIRMVIVVGFLATLVVGGHMTLRGELEVGSYSVLIFLTQRLLWPLTRLGNTFDLYQRAMASTTRVLDLLDTPVTIVDGAQALPKAQVEGRVRFRGVTFSYPERDPVLQDIDLELAPGTTTALVGPTGAGKSTLISLLLRFHDPQQGSVELDGVDVRQLRLRDLRMAVALVSQGTFLFPGTVEENIVYGREGASHAEIEAAATSAEAHGFVSELPEGYQTQIGEQGQKLSGGQRQRLSFARAVLKDAPLLVLDEATSAVDNETEAAMQRSLARIAQGRTTVVIAHRLSTIRHADQICVLDQGRIVERGTHEELLAVGGIYARLWSVQTGEAVEVEA